MLLSRDFGSHDGPKVIRPRQGIVARIRMGGPVPCADHFTVKHIQAWTHEALRSQLDRSQSRQAFGRPGNHSRFMQLLVCRKKRADVRIVIHAHHVGCRTLVVLDCRRGVRIQRPLIAPLLESTGMYIDHRRRYPTHVEADGRCILRIKGPIRGGELQGFGNVEELVL